MLQKILVPKVDLQSLAALDEQGFEILTIRQIRFRNCPSGTGDIPLRVGA